MISAFLVTACNDGVEVLGGLDSIPEKSRSVSAGHQLEGFVSKGPFVSGSEVKVFSLDESGRQTLVSKDKRTDKKSYYDFVVDGESYFQIVAKGKYFDEITGETSEKAIELSAIILPDANSFTVQANINVFTSLVAIRTHYLISQGFSLTEAFAQAQDELENTLSVLKCDISVPVTQLDIFVRPSDSIPKKIGNACLLAWTVSLLQHPTMSGESDPVAVVNLFKSFKTEGTFNANVVELLQTKMGRVNPAEVNKNMLTMPGFENNKIADADIVIDTDGDGISNRFDDDDDGDGLPDNVDPEPFNKDNDNKHKVKPVLIFVYIEGLNGELVLTDLNFITQGHAKYIFNKNGKQFLGNILTGAQYNLEILTQPEGQNCIINNSSGVAGIVTIDNVHVHCEHDDGSETPISYQLGGSISGLEEGEEIVMTNGQGDYLLRSENGSFSFESRLTGNTDYQVSLLSIPSSKECDIINGSGSVQGDVSDIVITCAEKLFLLQGTVNGLFGELKLANGLGETLNLEVDGEFSFSAAAIFASYKVAVQTHPENQRCSVENSSGVLLADVNNIIITCENWIPPVIPGDLPAFCEGFNYKRLFNMDFEAPIHTLGSVVKVDGSIYTPSMITFGNPTIVSDPGGTRGQVLEFIPNAASSPGGQYDQIKMELLQGASHYFVQFDVRINSMDAGNFTFIFDVPEVRRFDFAKSGAMTAQGKHGFADLSYLGSYTKGTWHQIVQKVDLNNSNRKIYIDGVLKSDAYFDTYWKWEDIMFGDIRDIRFSTGADAMNVMIDNLVVDSANCN